MMGVVRWCVAPIALAAGCGFTTAVTAQGSADGAPIDELGIDAAPDPPPPAPCAPDPALRLCFSFDQPALPAQLPNEGTADVEATLTDITRTVAPEGGAAQLAATSSIYLPMHADVSSILAIEVWFRIDTMPANTARSGLVDSNIVPPNISLFFYRQDPGHQLRCGLGGQTEVFDTTLATGRWHYAACTCDGANLAVYLDGTKLGERAGSCGSAGALVGDGLTIGSDNTGNGTSVADRLGGAIDGVRLWSVGLTGAQICERAGRTDC